jgi:hypothetical protein
MTREQGTASGIIMNDTIAMGGQRINSSFAVCDTVSPDLLAGNVSGVMGLWSLNVWPLD